VGKIYSSQGFEKSCLISVNITAMVMVPCYISIPAVKLLARNDANMKTLVDLGALELLVEMAKIGDDGEQFGKLLNRKKRMVKIF
jgi:hypothetical protein